MKLVLTGIPNSAEAPREYNDQYGDLVRSVSFRMQDVGGGKKYQPLVEAHGDSRIAAIESAISAGKPISLNVIARAVPGKNQGRPWVKFVMISKA